LQARESVRTGHVSPAHTWETVIVRERDWMPLPHPRVQADQSLHSDTAQLTSLAPVRGHGGHVVSLHVFSSEWFGGHAAPPWFALTETLRVRVWTPPPQFTVHMPHSDQSLMTQSTGQSEMSEQVPWSSRGGQVAPLHDISVVTVRARVLTPTPHVFEHVDQAAQSDTWQSTGQHPLLHVRVSVRTGHAAPLLAAPFRTVRVRSCEPPPHVMSHAP
jgi:hypothetical protein